MRARWIATVMAIGAFALGAAVSPSTAVAAFPGGNGLIAFSGSPDTGSGIFTIPPDGSGLHQLTNDAGSGLERDVEPSWSADGRRLVFVHQVYTSEADKHSVFTIDADGGDRTLVVSIGKSLTSPAPSFSPSGRRIVYAGKSGIHTIRPDGTKPHRLLSGYLHEPQYSPSGKRIVFAGLPKGKNRSGIWDMRRDGAGLRRLTDPSKRNKDLSDLAPDYSPDGRRIAFLRDTWLESGELRVMGANGSREHVVPASGYDPSWPEASSPAYSPAGDRIAIPRVDGSAKYGHFCSDIYTMSPTGSDSQKVTNACLGPPNYALGGVAVYPSWRPDPPSTFSFGGLNKSSRKGTAKLTVKVPGPGELELAKNRKVKGKQKSADSEGTVKLPVKPRRKAKKQLNRNGKAKVSARVIYTPDGGPPNTQSKKVGLKKKG